MKTITIGDLHGLGDWRKVEPDRYDRILFLGDYLDSFHLPDDQILGNLEAIIQFRLDHPEKVILLYGNHETSYLYPFTGATGYRPRMARAVASLFNTHSHLFQFAWQFGRYLWTHAGVHDEFYQEKIVPMIMSEDENLAATLNRLFSRSYPPLFELGAERNGPQGNVGGPLWIDLSRLKHDPLPGYHQVVGHTSVRTVLHYKPNPWSDETSVTFCDCIERGDGKFYELELE